MYRAVYADVSSIITRIYSNFDENLLQQVYLYNTDSITQKFELQNSYNKTIGTW